MINDCCSYLVQLWRERRVDAVPSRGFAHTRSVRLPTSDITAIRQVDRVVLQVEAVHLVWLHALDDVHLARVAQRV